MYKSVWKMEKWIYAKSVKQFAFAQLCSIGKTVMTIRYSFQDNCLHLQGVTLYWSYTENDKTLRKKCCTPKGSQLSICNMDLQWNRMQEIVTLLCKNKSILTWVLKKLVCMPELLSVSRDIPWWHCFIWSPFLEASQSKMPKHIWGWFAELGMIMISLDRFP